MDKRPTCKLTFISLRLLLSHNHHISLTWSWHVGHLVRYLYTHRVRNGCMIFVKLENKNAMEVDNYIHLLESL
jgi:hypothetical protein